MQGTATLVTSSCCSSMAAYPVPQNCVACRASAVTTPSCIQQKWLQRQAHHTNHLPKDAPLLPTSSCGPTAALRLPVPFTPRICLPRSASTSLCPSHRPTRRHGQHPTRDPRHATPPHATASQPSASAVSAWPWPARRHLLPPPPRRALRPPAHGLTTRHHRRLAPSSTCPYPYLPRARASASTCLASASMSKPSGSSGAVGSSGSARNCCSAICSS